jgi:PPOX class probable F420-dependent enzyme
VRLTEEEAQKRLAGARVARLGTAGGDGQPHVVPVTFAVDGDLIYTVVDHKPKKSTNLRRLRNIRENPRVDVLAERYEQYRLRRPAGPVIVIQVDHWKGWSSS